MSTTRRIVNDISFSRFIKELIHYVKKHPDCKLISLNVGDDERAENAFMFTAVLEYEE